VFLIVKRNGGFQELKRTFRVIGEFREKEKSVNFLKVWIRNIGQMVKKTVKAANLRLLRKLCAVSIIRQKGQPSPIQS
jgi:hypothetical protein